MARRLRNKDDGWKDVVGMPDEWDKQNVQTCINNFMKKKFKACEVFDTDEHECNHQPNISGKAWITECVRQTRHYTDVGMDPFNEFGIKNLESDARIVSSIPTALWNELADTMPTVFRDKDHFGWFVSNFKHYFLVPNKY